MKLNEIKHGFKLVSIKPIEDVSSVLYEYEHLVSGAHLAYLENDDTNCCFAIGFRTLPKDSTGVCHIIEHSVLCGSQKYPLKEPFVNLIKGSMATFLNAFTASDWTMYPIASQTPKDFNNLMSVYCDAVFRPLSMIDEKPFLQEGWHLELNSKDELPSYKGVVYNEMKGAMSDVRRILSQETTTAMYKDNDYRHNSGGDPDVIPDLTYQAYKDFYHQHYTPQNALTYLYGKMDVEEKLEFLDKEYFSKYQKSSNEVVIEKQKPFINTNYTKEYILGQNEELKDNTYMGLCFEIPGYDNIEDFLAFNVLSDALLSTNDSPLKKVLMDASLGQNVTSHIDDDNIQPALYLLLEKTNPEQKEKFLSLVIDSVKDIIKKGIDKDLLMASINKMKFLNKELDTGGTPKGLILVMNMIQAFNYRLPLEVTLESDKVYNSLKEKVNSNYFEKLLETYIVNSNHYVQTVINPSHTLEQAKKEKMDKLMKDIKDSLSEEQVDSLVKQTQDLIAYQNKVDTKEESDLLPKLSLSDIPTTVNYLEHTKTKISGIDTIVHNFKTNGIGYLRMYFDEQVIPFEDLPYVTLLSTLLTKLPTKNYSVVDLNNQIKTYLGKLQFNININSVKQDECLINLCLKASALNENISYVSPLVNEILFDTKYVSKEIKQILLQMANIIRSQTISQGHRCSSNESRSSHSLEGLYLSNASIGPRLYQFINELATNYDEDKVISKLQEISKKLFVKNNTIISISGDDEAIKLLTKEVEKIKLSEEVSKVVLESPKVKNENRAVTLPSEVNYNSLAFNLNEVGAQYTANLRTIAHIVTYDYLWNEIRVKGGAYGCNLSFHQNGDVALSTYRDPNVENSYKVFNNLPNYLDKFSDKDGFDGYIIGAMSHFEGPLSNPSMIDKADIQYLLGVTKKHIEDQKRQLLNTKYEDVKKVSKLIKAGLKNASKYTIGNEQKIKDSKQIEEMKPM